MNIFTFFAPRDPENYGYGVPFSFLYFPSGKLKETLFHSIFIDLSALLFDFIIFYFIIRVMYNFLSFIVTYISKRKYK